MAIVLVALASVACSTNVTPMGDAATLRLECATPLSTPLVPSTNPSIAGAPTMSIAWADDHCAFVADDSDPNVILSIDDFTGSALAYLTALSANHWAIESSSTGSSPTSYVTNLPHDADISVVMMRSGVSVTITFRVAGGTLVLVAMRLT